MPTSTSDRAYVWVWLPAGDAPVPAGILEQRPDGLWFSYGRRYLERPDALSLYGPELPLDEGWFPPSGDLGMPGSLRDAAPDSWGRRVILNRLTGARGRGADVTELSELAYLLNSGSDRLGAVDFQERVDEYVPRDETADLDELQEAARLVDEGKPLPSPLSHALLSGTAIGGARPKALVRDRDVQYIAKFSTSTDIFSVVGAEAASILLASRVGIDVPDAKVVTSLGREVLLTKRFDRPGDGGRLMVVSALTMLRRDETTFRYGTYPEILDVLLKYTQHAEGVAESLFRRIAFNIAISNTDDHLRNHAAFWDGEHLRLTPAYDLSPVSRSGEVAYQALAYGRGGERESRFADLIGVSRIYGLSASEARAIIDRVVTGIREHWDEAADFARLTEVDRAALWGRQFLNPGALYGL